jgi:histidinol-phosphatase (PHP family)
LKRETCFALLIFGPSSSILSSSRRAGGDDVQLYDQHLHSWNSFDCKTPPQQNVRYALEKELAGLTFTEHFDTHPTEWPGCVYDDAKITRELDALRTEFGDRLFIGKGIEVCYQPQRMNFILDHLARHEFDIVLLSVHWASDKPVHELRHFAGMDVKTYLRKYLEAVRAATDHVARMQRQGGQPFHVLGHLDFAKRYAFGHWGFDGPLDEPELVDDILTNCLEAGLIPEINTSTLRNGISAPMPGADVVERYAQLGGKCMSLGSDAHSPQYVGQDFDRALAIMRAAGIRELAVFRERTLTPEPIP